MMKKRIFGLLGLLGLLFISGCTKEENSKTPGTGTPVPTPTEAIHVTEEVHPGGDASAALTFYYKEEKDEAKDGDVVYFTSGLSYPVFEGRYAEQMNRVVAELIGEFRNWLPEARENAALDYADAKGTEYVDVIVQECETYAVNRLWGNEQIQVLFCNSYSYTGGAHPNTYYAAYVVNLEDGSRISIDSVLSRYAISKEELAEYAAERFKEEVDDGLDLHLEGEPLVNEIMRFMEETQWYLTENGVMLFANPYDIAPYAAGMIECEIPYEVLEEGLKK